MAVTLPWVVAPRDLAAGATLSIGRAADRDIEFTLGEPVPAGTVLGVDDTDGCLHPVPRCHTPRKRATP